MIRSFIALLIIGAFIITNYQMRQQNKIIGQIFKQSTMQAMQLHIRLKGLEQRIYNGVAANLPDIPQDI